MLASFPSERLCIFEISDHFGYYLNTRNHDSFHYLLWWYLDSNLCLRYGRLVRCDIPAPRTPSSRLSVLTQIKPL